MNIVVFLNSLGLGGTEKAACRWAGGLCERGHQVVVFSLQDGPRRMELERNNVEVRLVKPEAGEVIAALREVSPDAVHAHAPGHPHAGDILGQALAALPRVPVVQTNIFGQLLNPQEEAWTDFRLFVSWTSCVQAARRAGRRLDEVFFRRASVAVYPVDAEEPCSAAEVAAFRKQIGVRKDEVLFGRLSRPDPNKWTDLALEAFQTALRRNRALKLLLREPPPAIAEKLRVSPDADHFLILPATVDSRELCLTLSALDVVLHTSSIGESFGYGIAEPMNLGKPVITHSVPWHDQAQIELVRHGECGFIASTPAAMAQAILRLAGDATARQAMGQAGLKHIRLVADPATSVARVEQALRAAVAKQDNPAVLEDLRRASQAALYLDSHQFGHTLGEQLRLRLGYALAHFHTLRQRLLRSGEARTVYSPRR